MRNSLAGWVRSSHTGRHRESLSLGCICDPVASEKETSGCVSESEGERTKEGFLAEVSYSKAFPQLPNPIRKSPSPFTWH